MGLLAFGNIKYLSHFVKLLNFAFPEASVENVNLYRVSQRLSTLMGQLSRKVVNLSIMGVSATLVGIPALIATGIIVVIGLVVLYKIVTKPTINVNIW